MIELVSGDLEHTQIASEVSDIAEIYESLGHATLLVQLGWGTKADRSELWHDVELATGELCAFVAEKIREGVFVPGSSDLIVRDTDNTVQFLLCHESDIHLTTADEAVVDRVAAAWGAKGYRLNKSIDGKE